MRKPYKREVLAVVAGLAAAAGTQAVESSQNSAPAPRPQIQLMPGVVKIAEPLPGPNAASQSPGTPDPEDSSIPVPTVAETEPDAPINVGIPTSTPELPVPVPNEPQSTQVVVPAQSPKLAFTGPMEITASPFFNDQSTPGHPADVAGQGGPVNPDIHTPHMHPPPIPPPPVNPN